MLLRVTKTFTGAIGGTYEVGTVIRLELDRIIDGRIRFSFYRETRNVIVESPVGHLMQEDLIEMLPNLESVNVY